MTPLARSRLARNLSVSRLSFVYLSLSLFLSTTPKPVSFSRACSDLSAFCSRSLSLFFSLFLFHRLSPLSVFSFSIYFYIALGISAWCSSLSRRAVHARYNRLLEDDNGNAVTFVATLTFLLSIGRVACAPPVACCVTAFYDSPPLRLSGASAPSFFVLSRLAKEFGATILLRSDVLDRATSLRQSAEHVVVARRTYRRRDGSAPLTMAAGTCRFA